MGGMRKGSGGLAPPVEDIAQAVGGGEWSSIGKRGIAWNARRYSTRTTRDKNPTKIRPCPQGLFTSGREGGDPSPAPHPCLITKEASNKNHI